MAKVRVRINSRGARALLQSSEIAGDLKGRVDAIRAAAGDGYEADVQQGKTRQRGMVKTVTAEAMIDNARNNTLLKSVDRGR